MADFDLSGYNTVPERVAEFRAKYPEGCLRPADPLNPFTVIEAGGTTFVAYTAAAYRTPDDPLPGIGCAWEPCPGPTKFTRNSELQNAETAAWGRALIAVGAADSRKGIASREDVQSRAAEEEYYRSPEYADQQRVPGLRTAVRGALDKYVGDPPNEARALALKEWFAQEDMPRPERMNVTQCERAIDYLMTLPLVEES